MNRKTSSFDKAPAQPGFTLRAAGIAVLLSWFLLASTMYIAIKLGAAPWPIIFSVIVAGGLLRVMDRHKSTSIHEINVAQAGASIGGLVAAGIAFTVPGILFLNQKSPGSADWPESWWLGIMTAVAGLLGILLSVPLKQTFIDKENLPYPAGTAGAELLKLGKTGGQQLLAIIAVGAAAGAFVMLRDVYFPKIPFTAFAEYGIFITLLIMPLAISGGYILGGKAGYSWFGGAVAGWLLLIPILFGSGFERGPSIQLAQNLGMGLVLGSGIGFFGGYIIPRIKAIVGPVLQSGGAYLKYLLPAGLLSLAVLTVGGVPPVAALATISGVVVMVTVAARMTGETNINPLEQFGIFVCLMVAIGYTLAGSAIGITAQFMIITFVSVACAVAGDAGQDYKSGHIIGTRFMDIVRVDLIAVVAAGLAAPYFLEAIMIAFEREMFSETMPAAQATLVAGSIAGFAFPKVFWGGFAAAFLFEIIMAMLPERFRGKVLLMPFGIGLFLGLGLALPIAIGAFIRSYIDRHYPHMYQSGLLAAAGIMGGEGIAGFGAGAITILGIDYASAASSLMAMFVLVLIPALLVRQKEKGKRQKEE